MANIIYIGLDVHKEKIQACAFLAVYGFGEDRVLANIELGGNYQEIIKFASTLKRNLEKRHVLSVDMRQDVLATVYVGIYRGAI